MNKIKSKSTPKERKVVMTRSLLDKLDRIVIPKDICKALSLAPGSPVLFSVENGRVIITPEDTVCAVCGAQIPKGKSIRLCNGCIEQVAQIHRAEVAAVI
ncbi:MAG: AbrB/MazE/SpoVT family DNA-binding domain-containing protein [Clostridia bacterium]|nr:AbrB/MazE/SpoVT family DNA-binding domain-containing protein [Clostridia bacterium]